MQNNGKKKVMLFCLPSPTLPPRHLLFFDIFIFLSLLDRLTKHKSFGGISLSLIACTSECIYQQDGYCVLTHATSIGTPSHLNSCVNFAPRKDHSQNCTERLPNISDSDKL
ncbi:MAG: hypothetical protein ACLSAF_15615 [Intestinimonas sp.]